MIKGKPFVKWAGGKRQIIDKLLQYVPDEFNTYYEPFIGGEGAEVVYSLKNSPTFANLVLDNIGDAGQIKRKAYQRRLPENPNKDYYYVLREEIQNLY